MQSNLAVNCCLQEGRICKIAKSDNRSAFHNFGILPAHWKYLIIKAKSTINVVCFLAVLCNIYHVKSSSTSVCPLVLQLVVHILKQFLMQLCSLRSFNKMIVNYLDDYLFTHVHIFILLENRLLLELRYFFILFMKWTILLLPYHHPKILIHYLQL